MEENNHERVVSVQDPEFVRVRWWVQDTIESGHWEVSGLMGLITARKYYDSRAYDQLEIVLDEDGWPLYQGDWTDINTNNKQEPGSE